MSAILKASQINMIQVHEPDQQRHPTRLYRFIAIGFVALAAMIVVLTVYVVFSRAQVVVLSKQRDVEADLIVDVSTRPSNKEIAGGVFQLSKSATQTFEASSIVTIEMNAEGKVKIDSTLYRDQTLVASTRLLTEDGILFRLKETVVVPAFGSVEVNVFSIEAGSVGELSAGTKFIIPGLNEETRRFFTVRSVGVMSGGRKDMRLVTPSDIVKAEDLLKERLQSEIAETLREKARTEDLSMTGELFAYEITRSTGDMAAGEEAAEFTVSVTVNGQVVFYDQEAFKNRVQQLLADRLPFDRLLARFDLRDDEMSLEKIDLIGQRANIRVKARGSSVLSAEASGLDPAKLVNVTTDAATEYLESLDGVSSASIKMRPFWARRLPGTTKHILIEVR